MAERPRTPEARLVGPFTTAVHLLALATLVLYVVLAAAGTLVYVTLHNQARRNASAVAGLCALRVDLEQRKESSERFLREHPNGIPGIPVSLIREGIRNETKTLQALDVVACPGRDSG